jgi:hypothetical protein
MITFIHFIKRLVQHHEVCPVPAEVLRDIGISKIINDFR